LKKLAERRKWLHALDSDDIDEKNTDDADNDSDGVDLSDKSVDVSAAYTALLAKYNALLNQVSGVKKKCFYVLFRDEEDELYVHANYEDDSDVRKRRK
jgi:hypothetical protein